MAEKTEEIFLRRSTIVIGLFERSSLCRDLLADDTQEPLSFAKKPYTCGAVPHR